MRPPKPPPVVVRIYSPKPAPAPRPVAAARPDDTPPSRPNPVAVAHACLGPRLEERDAGFFLDRVPAGLDAVVRAANRVLKANGHPQLGANPRWRV